MGVRQDWPWSLGGIAIFKNSPSPEASRAVWCCGVAVSAAVSELFMLSHCICTQQLLASPLASRPSDQKGSQQYSITAGGEAENTYF